jgi:hypothetical protein
MRVEVAKVPWYTTYSKIYSIVTETHFVLFLCKFGLIAFLIFFKEYKFLCVKKMR